MIKSPPMTAAEDKGSSFRSQSTIATRKMVMLRVGQVSQLHCEMKRPSDTHRAATDESTGEVREMRIRNDPENARTCQRDPDSRRSTHWHSPTPRSSASKQSHHAEAQTARFQ